MALAHEAGEDRILANVVRLTESALCTLDALDRRERLLREGIVAAEGSIAYGLGLALATVGHHADAAAAYDLALTVNQRLRAPLFVARTQLAYAELLTGSEPGRARALLTDARKVAG